jgi:GDP-L-fucose synthase
VDKFVMVGTVCSYPKFCSVPFNEEDLWNGFPEETNAPYGIAKKTLGVMLKAYYNQYNLKSIILMPCNLYGPGDNFDDKSSHVIPALIKKFVHAKQNNLKSVHCWGDGSATREFLYVNDAARAIAMSINNCGDAEIVNLGSSGEISIRELAEMIKSIVGFGGEIIWDKSMPNGQPRRLLDTTKAKKILGWEPKVEFTTGLTDTINWWINQQSKEEKYENNNE